MGGVVKGWRVEQVMVEVGGDGRGSEGMEDGASHGGGGWRWEG